MIETNFAQIDLNPFRAYLKRGFRPLRGLAVRVATRLDPIVLLVLLWTAGFIAFGTTPVRRPDGHAAISDFWLMPTGMAIGLMGLLLAWDDCLDRRDQIPWRLMMVAGLLMPFTDGLWLFADAEIGLVPVVVASAAGLVPLIMLAAAVLLFRRSRSAQPRARILVVVDFAAVALMATLTIWYFVLEPQGTAGRGDLVAWAACGGSAVLVILILARIAILPVTGLSANAATALVLGGAAAIVGAVAVGGPTTVGAAGVGQLSLALLRTGLLIGG